MNPAGLPCARELFAQWQRLRGDRTNPAQRPFSRSWEELLEAARIISATERSEAERDAKALEVNGWIQLKPVRYKPHLIDQVIIPLPAEARWQEAFGFSPPSDEEARQIREFAWEPELAFLRQAKINLPLAELCQLNQCLKERPPEIIPIKERSLQIFGDEKRLDMLLSSSLFRPDRLDFKKHLGCEMIGVPLAWKRGPAKAAGQPVIIIENAATWHSYCRWNAERAFFSAVVYGDGNRVVDGVRYLADLFDELHGPRQQPQRSRIVLWRHIVEIGIEVVPDDRHPQARHVQAQLVGLTGQRPQTVQKWDWPQNSSPKKASLCRTML